MDLDSPFPASADEPRIQAFRPVPRTGVIFVTTEANARGFRSGDPEWCNLGQGQPESGPLAGAPDRIVDLEIDPTDHEYAPIAGVDELREAVAALYNELYRRGMKPYTPENVAISGGGRAALTRAVAALGRINLGHFLPDYTAYEELLEIFRLVSPIPILLSRERGYEFPPTELRREVLGRGLGALLVSNPCNPTGKLVGGAELREWIGIARELDSTLLLDEFYSHYVWRLRDEPGPTVSAARWVEDPERDPVVIVDGLTKNWRYPGWRVTWTLGPTKVIEAVASAGSFLDGGGSRPLQRAAVPLLEPSRVRAEAAAIGETFARKRELMLARAREIGLAVDREPDGTFYVWASLRGLPPALADGMAFFRAALEEKVICVPGVFFDVNPGRRRQQHHSRFRQHVRLSFGPEIERIEEGMARLGRMIERARY